jgi:hypothetical protein
MRWRHLTEPLRSHRGGQGFKSSQLRGVISQEIGMTLNPDGGSGSLVFSGVAGFAGGLVVAVGVDGEFAKEFAGGGVDDADVEVLDEFESMRLRRFEMTLCF